MRRWIAFYCVASCCCCYLDYFLLFIVVLFITLNMWLFPLYPPNCFVSHCFFCPRFVSQDVSCILCAVSLPCFQWQIQMILNKRKTLNSCISNCFSGLHLTSVDSIYGSEQSIDSHSDNTFASIRFVSFHFLVLAVRVLHYFARDKSSYDTMFEWEAINLFGLASRNG